MLQAEPVQRRVTAPYAEVIVIDAAPSIVSEPSASIVIVAPPASPSSSFTT